MIRLCPANWALVFVTGALVVATVILAVFAGVQAMAGRNATKQAKRQADPLADGLDVSRAPPRGGRGKRAAAAPLELRVVDLIEPCAGNTVLNIANASMGAAMRLARVEVVEVRLVW